MNIYGVLSNKMGQVIVSVLLALFTSVLINEFSVGKLIPALLLITLFLYLYKKFSHLFRFGPALLVKLLVFFGLIDSSIIIMKVGPISVFPYRLLAPIVVFLFFVQLLKKDEDLLHWKEVQVKPVLGFFAFWICYCLFSLVWVKAVGSGVKELIFLSLGIAFIFLFVFYLYKLQDYLHLYYIWLVGLALFVAIGLWEHFTGHHLPTSRIPDMPSWYQHIPTAVFHNENDFATFLTLSIFFLIPFVKYVHDVHFKIYGTVLGCLSLYLIYETMSRANFLALAVGFLFYYSFIMKPRIRRMTFPFVVSIVGVGLILSYRKLFELISKIYDFTGSVFGDPQNSAGIRINLLRNAFHFFTDTFGLGVGSGNVEYYMATYERFPTEGTLNVHNWWMEILVDYGALVFVGYVLVFIMLIVSVYRVFKLAETDSQKMISEALLGGLFVFPIACISPSSIMTMKFQWIFLAFATGYVNYFWINQGLHKEWRKRNVRQNHSSID